jgi:hypothetical protein
MDAHSGTFSDFFFSRRTKGDHPHRGQRIDSPPPLQKIKSNFPPNKKLGIKSKN